MIDPPKESGRYMIEYAYGDGGIDVVDVSVDVECCHVSNTYLSDRWEKLSITRYRRLTDDDLRELLHGPQPSGVPDRSGWWRCVIRHGDGYRTVAVVEIEYCNEDDEGNPRLSFLHGLERVFVDDERVTFYGRVEMPGEK